MRGETRDEPLDKGRLARPRGGRGDREHRHGAPLVRDPPECEPIGGGRVYVEEQPRVDRKRNFLDRELSQNDAEFAVAARDSCGECRARFLSVERGERLPVSEQRRQNDLAIPVRLGQQCAHEVKIVERHIAREDERPLRRHHRKPRRNRGGGSLRGAFVDGEPRAKRRRDGTQLLRLALRREDDLTESRRASLAERAREQGLTG